MNLRNVKQVHSRKPLLSFLLKGLGSRLHVTADVPLLGFFGGKAPSEAERSQHQDPASNWVIQEVLEETYEGNT